MAYKKRVFFITAFPPASISPTTGDAKSVDEDNANNFNSINSEEVIIEMFLFILDIKNIRTLFLPFRITK